VTPSPSMLSNTQQQQQGKQQRIGGQPFIKTPQVKSASSSSSLQKNSSAKEAQRDSPINEYQSSSSRKQSKPQT
jgi:hypothetical protein